MKKRNIEAVIYDVDVENGMRFIREVIWAIEEHDWDWFKKFCNKSKDEGLKVKNTVSVRYEMLESDYDSDDFIEGVDDYIVLPLTKKLFNKISCVYMTDGEVYYPSYCYKERGL